MSSMQRGTGAATVRKDTEGHEPHGGTESRHNRAQTEHGSNHGYEKSVNDSANAEAYTKPCERLSALQEHSAENECVCFIK
jgi:hypothetical protein